MKKHACKPRICCRSGGARAERVARRIGGAGAGAEAGTDRLPVCPPRHTATPRHRDTATPRRHPIYWHSTSSIPLFSSAIERFVSPSLLLIILWMTARNPGVQWCQLRAIKSRLTLGVSVIVVRVIIVAANPLTAIEPCPARGNRPKSLIPTICAQG